MTPFAAKPSRYERRTRVGPIVPPQSELRDPSVYSTIDGESASQPEVSVRVRPTLAGWILIFLFVWIPLTAIGTANNFLLIIFSMIVGLMLISHRLGGRNVKTVRLSRRFPDEIFAGKTFAVRYVIKADRRPWGAITLKFVEGPPLQGTPEGVAFFRVPPGEAVSARGFFSISSRGYKQILPGVLTSAFPFGLASYSRKCGPPESVLVFPRICPVQSDIPPWVGGYGKGLERADPLGTVPYQFREYVPGDPYKYIEWKKTAGTGRLITKVLSDEGTREITIRLPALASERAISRAASLVVHFAESSRPICLQGPGLLLGPGRGKEFALKILTRLARWESSPEDAVLPDHASDIMVQIDEAGEFLWSRPGERNERIS